MNKISAATPFFLKSRVVLAFALFFCSFGVFAQPQAQAPATPITASQATVMPTQAAPMKAAPRPRTLVAGRDYWVLSKPMPAPADRLEVAYFFWYNSPMSAQIDPLIRRWVATKASPLVKFRPLPAVLENQWSYGARLFFAMKEMNREEIMGPKIFRALSDGVVDYNSPKSMSDWMRDQGVSVASLSKSINSPNVIAQTSWMPSLMKRYGVERVPTVVIDGQFLFVSSANEKPEDFISKISFASEALTQRKLKEIALTRKTQGAKK